MATPRREEQKSFVARDGGQNFWLSPGGEKEKISEEVFKEVDRKVSGWRWLVASIEGMAERGRVCKVSFALVLVGLLGTSLFL